MSLVTEFLRLPGVQPQRDRLGSVKGGKSNGDIRPMSVKISIKIHISAPFSSCKVPPE